MDPSLEEVLKNLKEINATISHSPAPITSSEEGDCAGHLPG